MKKRLLSLLLIIGIFLINIPLLNVSAEENDIKFENPDQIFRSTVKEFEEYQNRRLNFDRRELYNINLDECGYYYEFNLNGEEGYAFALGSENTGYNIDEIYFDSISPFETDEEMPVYVSSGTVLSYNDGVYSDARTGEIVLASDYCGTDTITCTIDEVAYERKVSTQNQLTFGIPFYYQTSFDNSCACVAGSIILGYFDKMYTYCVPDYSTYDYGTNVYYDDSTATRAVSDQLYYDMQTNVYNGTSFSRFISGMQAYLTRINRSFSYNSILSSGTLNYESFKTSMAAQKPVVIFMSGFNIISEYYEGSGVDYWYVNKNTANHVMVAYGNRDIYYYRTETKSVWSPVWYNPFRYITVTEEVNFRTDTYLKLSTGIGGAEKAYMRLYQDNESMDYAITVNIY